MSNTAPTPRADALRQKYFQTSPTTLAVLDEYAKLETELTALKTPPTGIKISDLMPLLNLLDVIEPTHEHSARKMTQDEIKAVMKHNGDNLGVFRTKFKPSECLQIIQIRKHFKAIIEAAQLEGRDTI